MNETSTDYYSSNGNQTQYEKPKILSVLSDNIPQELRPFKRWVTWHLVYNPEKKKKWDKPLFDAKIYDDPYIEPRDKCASSTDPSTWAPLQLALTNLTKGADGIGFCLAPPFAGADVDNCVVDGVINEFGQYIINTLDSYTEFSPSGTGIRIIFKGKLKYKGNRDDEKGIEIYDHARYLTITGHHVEGTPFTINERSAQAEELQLQFFPQDVGSEKTSDIPYMTQDDEAILHLLRTASNHDKIDKLWAGDLSDYHNDHSRADQALCNLIAFYTRDPEQIDRIFRQSALFRIDKWEIRNDYRIKTIKKALEQVKDSYNPGGYNAVHDFDDQINKFFENKEEAPKEELKVEKKPPQEAPKQDPVLTAAEEILGEKVKYATTPYIFAPLTSAAFATARYTRTWLVSRLVVKDQPGIIAGPSKSLKTNQLVDFAISLGTATPFLNYFNIPKAYRVAFISGESGEATLQETAFRICESKKINLADADVLWDFRLPKLAKEEELSALAHGLRKWQADIVIIDPVYLTLLSGQKEITAGNMFDMGPLLLAVAQACMNVNVTPFLCHHTKKFAGTDYEPIDLTDIAFSGFGEFARQWLLINRRHKYQCDGSHELWLQAGGSSGQSGLYGVNIDEGELGEDFSGRTWVVDILTIDQIKEEKAERKAEKKEEEDRKRRNDFLAAVEGPMKGQSKTKLKKYLGYRGEVFNRILKSAIDQGLVEVVDAKVPTGKNRSAMAEVVQRILQ